MAIRIPEGDGGTRIEGNRLEVMAPDVRMTPEQQASVAQLVADNPERAVAIEVLHDGRVRCKVPYSRRMARPGEVASPDAGRTVYIGRDGERAPARLMPPEDEVRIAFSLEELRGWLGDGEVDAALAAALEYAEKEGIEDRFPSAHLGGTLGYVLKREMAARMPVAS